MSDISLTGIQTIAPPPPPRKIAPRLGFGFWSRLGLVLGLGETRQLSPRKIVPQLWLRFGLGLFLGLESNFSLGNCPRTPMFLLPIITNLTAAFNNLLTVITNKLPIRYQWLPINCQYIITNHSQSLEITNLITTFNNRFTNDYQ